MARLVVITKGAAPLSHELGEGWTTIGRADDNIFQIVEKSVSSHHCEVKVKGDELLVRDLISTNGTFVGIRQVSEGVVSAGGTLRLGDVELRFDATDLAPAAAAGFNSKMLVTHSANVRRAAPVEKKTSPVSESAKAEPERQFQVLFVDDSLAFIESFGGLCEEFSGLTWKIHKATTADVALSILREKPIDLIVLDIGMPMVDGLQLLSIINRRSPGLKIAIITGQVTEARRADALANGAALFLEKPVTPEAMQSTFNMLLDLLLWKREGFTGALRQVSLQEVIQVECSGGRSSILEIRSPELHGQIYLHDGAVIHAVARELTGDAAFKRLLELSGGEFQLKPFQPPASRTINTSWQFLLMNLPPSKKADAALFNQVVEAPSDPDTSFRHIVVGENLMSIPIDEKETPPGHQS